MTRYHRAVALAACVLLFALSVHHVTARASDSPAQKTAQPGGFVTESNRRARTVVASGSDGLVDRLCDGAAREFAHRCPPGAKDVSDSPGPVDEVTAGLPHLRLNIVLREMRNVVVSGSGVDSLGILQEPWATFKIESIAASDSIPEPADGPYALPVPPPDDTWSDIPHANALFQGIIENGCIGAPATFDLTLESSIVRASTGDVLGTVHLVDTVQGYGYYNFEYAIRATDENGNVSDFAFSGDADAYCTSEPAFSASVVGSAAAVSDSATPQVLQQSDFITQEDIDRSPDGYRLSVPALGDVYVKALRASAAARTCHIHKPSLIAAVAADPPVAAEPYWIQLTIYDCPWVGTCCAAPLGGGCYVMVKTSK
jgi:hypothetical protein